MFRPTFGHLWRESGGEEGDLMVLGGWKSRAMLDRYCKGAAVKRAKNAHRRFSPATASDVRKPLRGAGWPYFTGR